jgi:putative ABC transport system permease protein
MYKIALKMLTEDKAKYVGMILSISFSTLIITQQAAIFIGLMLRTISTIDDINQADIWVMDYNVQMIDDIKPLRDTDLYRVRSIKGVSWAMPLFRSPLRARLSNGKFQTSFLVGIDDATLIGAPYHMVSGCIENLRYPDAVIVDKVGSQDKLAIECNNGQKTPLAIGDVMELNDRRAVVVGICDVNRPFFSQPIIYTTYSRALTYAPYERKLLSFILVKADSTISPKELCNRIQCLTPFAAYTKKEFEDLTIWYYLQNTGIPINFGLAVLLGILIGAVIAGQIFYNFITDNLKYLALLSVMGASDALLARITILQALWVAFLGWGIGSGTAAFIGYATENTELSFHLPWQLFIGCGLIIFSICAAAAFMNIRRIFNVDLAMVFKQ